MNQKIKDARTTIELVKSKLRAGESYHACKAEAQPAIDTINEEGKKIAKKYGQRYKPVSFTGIMR